MDFCKILWRDFKDPLNLFFRIISPQLRIEIKWRSFRNRLNLHWYLLTFTTATLVGRKLTSIFPGGIKIWIHWGKKSGKSRRTLGVDSVGMCHPFLEELISTRFHPESRAGGFGLWNDSTAPIRHQGEED